MRESKAQMTRALASDMMKLEGISEVINHNGSCGQITFNVCDSVSVNRVSKLLPDGWCVEFVVTPSDYTTAYITKE